MAGDKFMPELHLRQPRYIYSAYGTFTKHCKQFKNLEKQVIWSISKRTNWTKLVLVMHDTAYFDSKDLVKKNYFRKGFKDKSYEKLL